MSGAAQWAEPHVAMSPFFFFFLICGSRQREKIPGLLSQRRLGGTNAVITCYTLNYGCNMLWKVNISFKVPVQGEGNPGKHDLFGNHCLNASQCTYMKTHALCCLEWEGLIRSNFVKHVYDLMHTVIVNESLVHILLWVGSILQMSAVPSSKVCP